MAQSGVDIYGSYLDTGTSTVPTVRANVEIEVHNANEVDSGSKLLPTTTLVASHGPHRDSKSPR